MLISIFGNLIEFGFTCYCIFEFGCGVGDCENGLVCCLYYIKFLQTLVLISTYHSNRKEKQPNHPISTINTFIVICLYYICLYQEIGEIKEDKMMVHYCAVFIVIDALLIVISIFGIKMVKKKAQELIDDSDFKEYKQEAQLALADILYLPQEFESDDGEDEF